MRFSHTSNLGGAAPRDARSRGRRRASLGYARHARSSALWLACLSVPCWPSQGRAEPSAATAAGSESKAERGAAKPSAAEEPREVGIGASAGRGDAGTVGTLLVGADAWYRWSRHLAAGLEGQAFVVDNGADGHNCGGCLDGGSHVTAFVEARAAAGSPVSVFGRFGVGPGWLRRWAKEGGTLETHVQPVFQFALGPQLTLGPVFLRLRGTLTAADAGSFAGYGLELGFVL